MSKKKPIESKGFLKRKRIEECVLRNWELNINLMAIRLLSIKFKLRLRLNIFQMIKIIKSKKKNKKQVNKKNRKRRNL
jgi:hypothetical protein